MKITPEELDANQRQHEDDMADAWMEAQYSLDSVQDDGDDYGGQDIPARQYMSTDKEVF